MPLQYKQYTTCIKAEDFRDFNKYLAAFLYAAGAGLLGALIIRAASSPACWPFVVVISVIQGLLAYCLYDLTGRLICLDDVDQTMVGVLISVEVPEEKTGPDRWDTDVSINLLPPTNELGADQTIVAASEPYGKLVREHDLTRARGLPLTGARALDKPSGLTSAVLHAEFEGPGVYRVFVGAQIAFGLAVLALIACLAFPGPVGMIVGWILIFLAILAIVIAAIYGLRDSGSPNDVDPELAELHTNVKDADGVGRGAHILFVAGRWVYDSGHNNRNPGEGWNEIHPIKYCSIVGTWDGAWPTDIDVLIADQQDQYEKTISPETREAQEKPENQWEVHPLVDGCQVADSPVIS
jgi:hypothetical protein